LAPGTLKGVLDLAEVDIEEFLIIALKIEEKIKLR